MYMISDKISVNLADYTICHYNLTIIILNDLTLSSSACQTCGPHKPSVKTHHNQPALRATLNMLPQIMTIKTHRQSHLIRCVLLASLINCLYTYMYKAWHRYHNGKSAFINFVYKWCLYKILTGKICLVLIQFTWYVDKCAIFTICC